MIIVEPGDETKKHRPWWAGKKVICHCCGQLHQLEDSDYLHPYVNASHEDRVEVLCSLCWSITELNKPFPEHEQ